MKPTEPTRWVLIVAIEEWSDREFGVVPYALSGAARLSESLGSANIPATHQTVLLAARATKTAITSRLKKLKQSVRRGDTLIVYWCGRSIRATGQTALLAWDSLADDVPDTAILFAELLPGLARTRAEAIVVLLDLNGARDEEEIANLVAEHPRLTVVTTASAGESIGGAAGLKSPLGTHVLTEAFRERGTVSARALHRRLVEQLPRFLRAHLEPGAVQTPQLFAGDTADVILSESTTAEPEPSSLLDPARLRRVAFRSESSTRVRDLAGWRKSFDLPTTATPASQKFVARIAAVDLRADLDLVVNRSRDQLGTRRKDLSVTVGNDGVGTLRTPQFEYTVMAELDRENPTQMRWLREVSGFADVEFVRGGGFDSLFGPAFDRLAFSFQRPVAVSELADRLEEQESTFRVEVDVEATECVIALSGIPGRVVVRRLELVVEGRSGNSAGLLDLFLSFLERTGPLGDALALPPGH